MIQKLATILILIVLVLHAVLGCCWHHAHACDSMGNLRGHRSCSEKGIESHCHDHSDAVERVIHVDSPFAEEGGHEDQLCDEELCVFTASSRTTFVAANQSLLSIDVPMLISSQRDGLTTTTISEAMRGSDSHHWDCAPTPQWTQSWLL